MDVCPRLQQQGDIEGEVVDTGTRSDNRGHLEVRKSFSGELQDLFNVYV